MQGSRRVVPDSPTQQAMGFLWLVFTTAYLVFFYVFQSASEIADSGIDGYLEVLLLGLPTVVLLGGMMWLRESDVDDDLHPRVVGWTVGVALVFLVAMAAGLFIIETRFDPGELWLILLLSVGVGASAGVVMGALEIRSKAHERERNRSIRIARRKERERSQLEHLNHYLRHEVLNETNKISGYAELLADRAERNGTDIDYLDGIRRSSQEIAAFIESIRTILDTTDHEPQLTDIDLLPVLETEAKEIRMADPSVTVDVDCPASVSVLAGDLVGRVFRNLMENAIEHNGESVTITLTVEENEEMVRVRVRDDGEGIPAEKRDELFDPPDGEEHGYGLFFARNLAWLYGGRLELAETGPDGTEFVVHLPAASAESSDPLEGDQRRGIHQHAR